MSLILGASTLQCGFSLWVQCFNRCVASFCRKRRRDYQRQKLQKEREKHEEVVRRQAIENELRAKQLEAKSGFKMTKGKVITAAIAAATAPKQSKVGAKQVRLVRAKAERPNHPSRGGQPARGVLHDNDTDMTP